MVLFFLPITKSLKNLIKFPQLDLTLPRDYNPGWVRAPKPDHRNDLFTKDLNSGGVGTT